MNTLLILRMIERFLAVGIGGLCIFFGYRLFLALPDMRDANGQMSLPMNIQIVVSRVGPGVFFALFGAGVVALSLYQSIKYERTLPGAASASDRPIHESFAGLGETTSSRNEMDERANARALLRRDFAVLNTIPRYLRPELPPQDTDQLAATIERVKLALMRPVWGTPEEGWGDQAAFEAWLKSGQPSPPPAPIVKPAQLFLYGAAQVSP
jgi:hypothetical protein